MVDILHDETAVLHEMFLGIRLVVQKHIHFRFRLDTYERMNEGAFPDAVSTYDSHY